MSFVKAPKGLSHQLAFPSQKSESTGGYSRRRWDVLTHIRPGASSFRVLISASWYQSMTTHSRYRYRFIGDAIVLAYLLNALFAILLAALLLFLLTYMGWPTEDSYSHR
jgi:hypothetical protein